MSKQTKNINYFEIFRNTNSQLSQILLSCENGKALEKLNKEEREKLWACLFNIIKENNKENLPQDNIYKLKTSIELIYCILNNCNLGSEIKNELISIISYLNSDEFLIEENDTVNIISKINEYWIVKLQSSEEIPGMEYFTLKHLFSLCVGEKPLVSDIQRLSAIRKFVTAIPFDQTVPSLRPFLIKLVQKFQVLSSEHGQRFIAQTLILSQKIMTEIHKTVMLDLGSCSKKKASMYGKIYVMAWHVASSEMKRILEKCCFQHLMECILKEQRTSLELNKNSQNILAVLEVWHSERKKKNPDFITMITNAYQPILWKYLQSGFNVHRCNATDVFFKAFPLQRCSDNAIEAEKLFNLQFDTMVACLKDDCHIVRIISIREVCNILSHYWNSFSPEQIQNLMTVITKNANDASSAEVRRMVYISFKSLVNSPLSCEYVKQILPNMANNIHDINQRVRISFIQLLICIKEKKDLNFKYSDVVSMFNLQYRLAEDNIAVGQWIVKLLMKNYYHSKMPVVEWTKRFIYFVKTYKASYRNFFFYSSKSLSFLDACNIIFEILTQLGLYVISKSATDQENNENFEKNPKEKKKGNKKLPLSDWNASKVSPETQNNSKKCAFDDHEVVSGLFDIVTILWVLHDIQLNKPENEEIRLKLYDTYIKYAQPFITYYKDCDLFLCVLSLSGNIPASLLRNNSITLPGYCIKMLKTIKMDSKDEDNEKIISMLIALVKWGRGSEILEQVNLWLDAAFETQNLNETILPRRKVKISETIQPNSIVAIYILDSLLKKEYVKLSILKKNYRDLFFLWKFMSRIRKLVETRLENGEPFEEDLVSDKFLVLCFRRYVKLIPLLKEDNISEEEKKDRSEDDTAEIFVNRQKEIENIIEWAENLFFPILQQEELEDSDADLITNILEDILYVSDNMITVHMVNNLFYFKAAHFVLKLLNTKYGICFIKSSSRITVALNYSAKVLFKVKDDLQIFSTVIPSLLSHTLKNLTNEKISIKDLKKLEEDMPVIKKCFAKILDTFQDNLKSTSSLKENVRQLKLIIGFFVDCIITVISNEVPREDSSIPLYVTPSQLPSVASFLFSFFYNRKTWTSLFIHVINSKFVARSFDPKSVVSAILLIHLYAVSDKKANQEDLKKALSSALKSLNNSKALMSEIEEKVCNMSVDTITKKTWSSNVATRGYSSSYNSGFLPKERNSERNTSEETINHESKTDKGQCASENCPTSSSFRCEGKNLEQDLINCGFELIKTIESALQKQIPLAENS